MRVEMYPQVVLQALMGGKDNTWRFTVTISVSSGEEERSLRRAKLTCGRGKFDSTRGGFVSRQNQVRGTHGRSREKMSNSCTPSPLLSISNSKQRPNKVLERRKGHVVGKRGLEEVESPPCPKAPSDNRPRPKPGPPFDKV